MDFGFLELDSGYQSPGFQIAQEMISPIPDPTGKIFLESRTGLPYIRRPGRKRENTPGVGRGGCCHIWVIQVRVAVKGMVFKQFTLEQGI